MQSDVNKAPVTVGGGALPAGQTSISDLKKQAENIGEEFAQAAIADAEAIALHGPMDNEIPVPPLDVEQSGSFTIPLLGYVYNYTVKLTKDKLIFKATPQ